MMGSDLDDTKLGCRCPFGCPDLVVILGFPAVLVK